MDKIRHTLCYKYDYNVIGVTETWLTAATPSDDANLHIDNYAFYRKDREYVNGRGGGVEIFVSNTLLCVPRMDLSPREAELLWVEVRADKKRILVGVCYRPPGQNRDEQNAFLMALEKTLNVYAWILLLFYGTSMISVLIRTYLIHRVKSEINFRIS